MLMRIASLVALALSWASLAQAAPPKVKEQATPQADEWRTNVKGQEVAPYRLNPARRLGTTTPMTQPVVDEGRIEKLIDGAVIYSIELNAEARQMIATKKGVPVSKVPERVYKTARLDMRTLDMATVKNRIGEDVKLELRQDPAGYIYITSLTSKK